MNEIVSGQLSSGLLTIQRRLSPRLLFLLLFAICASKLVVPVADNKGKRPLNQVVPAIRALVGDIYHHGHIGRA